MGKRKSGFFLQPAGDCAFFCDLRRSGDASVELAAAGAVRVAAIAFWQALGLLVLCRMLFGGFGGHGRSHRPPMREGGRWEKMTPEEREKFRQDMRARWCNVGAPDGESKEPA